MQKVRMGFDLGGTNMRSALVSEDGEVIFSNECETLAQEEADKVINRIKNLIKESVSKAEEKDLQIQSIGIGVPGVIDTDSGIVKSCPNIPHWKNIELGKIISEEFGIKTKVDNDVRVTALGEYYFGAGKGYKNILCVAVGTGIGGGIILNGEIMRGPSQSMGEIGHITLKKDGPLCGCGNYGCLESLASSLAIIREAKEVLDKGKSEIMEKQLEHGMPISAYFVTKALHDGDIEAARIMREVGEWLGIGLASVVNLLNPEIIIIGGGVSLAGNVIFNPVKEEIAKRALKIPRELVKVVPAQLGDSAGMIGASAL
ncbi:MAG: ROK family protein [Candidatus Sericytochromatia bacterium]|nr:ROK family protein [Candidatus Sericytochromatia bacterium]